MLKRKPTKIELKDLDDKEELEEARRRAAAATAAAAAAASSGSKLPAEPLRPKLTVAQRIGLSKSLRHFQVEGTERNGDSSMEIEVKFKLSGPEAHEKVAALLKPFHEVTHMQENVFFDGANKELSSKKSVLRVRFYDEDKKCEVTYKGNAVIESGISRGEELEEEIDCVQGQDFVANPKRIATSSCQLLKTVVSNFGATDFTCLGGFRNIRNVYNWEALKIELDETQFDFGTSYEVECESTDPERVRQVLGHFFESNGIEYSYSIKSKFAVFRSGKLD